MNDYRVIAIHHRWKNKGEWNEERIQHLQKKQNILFFTYWKTIDSEIVPSFAWLHKAIFGDRPDWDSKFKEYIK